MPKRCAFRATVVHCLADPGSDANNAVEAFADGLLLTEDGRVTQVGPAADLMATLGESVEVVDLSGYLLVPGLIDCHVHYPQFDMIGAYGAQLLDWLERFAYPEEQKFADYEHAHAVADRFADALLQNGTTTALVFATVHPASVEAMFAAAQARGMRLITGKVAMDSGCPVALRDDPVSAVEDSVRLIEKWHGQDRLGYAITPRFALTSSAEQLTALGQLAARYPDVHVHSHVAESRAEMAAVAARFPKNRSYLDVYKTAGLLRERSVLAHCLHLDDADRQCMAEHKVAAAFCPSSNLFLGSGLYDLAAMDAAGVRTGIGTDVGGGTSLSVLRTLADGYKALQLQGQSLAPFKSLYLATLGAARALRLEDRIGNFAAGKEADFTVLGAASGSHLAHRMASANTIAEQLFALLTLSGGDDVHSTYLLGVEAYRREP